MSEYLYYPMLDRIHSIPLIKSHLEKPLEKMAGDIDCHHEKAYPHSLASTQVSREHLQYLRSGVRELAESFGFPYSNSKSKKAVFDQHVGTFLFNEMHILPTEAADERVWNFFTLVVSPEVAAWRFPNRKRDPEFPRWIGSRRNVFRKCWWRAYVLGPELNESIGEDEGVNIMERPTFGGNPQLARRIVQVHLEISKNRSFARSEILRAAMVQLSRIAMLVDLRVLENEELDTQLENAFELGIAFLEAKATLDSKSA